jgi:membrane protease YdiL (CAAX protease family)
MTAWARRFPLLIYFALAYVFTWSLLPRARTSTVVALIALCGPAAAAFSTAALGGRDMLQDLRKRVLAWRVPLFWYALALLLPLAISALRTAIESLWGAPGPIAVQPITALAMTVFVLVAGEEVGWRGFALPRLLVRFGPWYASLLVGLLWSLWHLPLFYMAGMPQHGMPFPPYVAYVIGLSILLTWLAQCTLGSVIIATLFHGAVNTFGLTNAGADSTLRAWGNALAYGVVALGLGIVVWKLPLTHRHRGNRDAA